MADIFISYARADRDKIEQLAAALEGESYSVWWDRRIQSGAEFSKDIEAELDAAKAVVVCWSADANKSRWVKDEANAGAEAGKLMTVTLDGEMPPIGFRQFHCADLSSWRGKPAEPVFQEFNTHLKARISGEASTPPPTITAKPRHAGIHPSVLIVAIVALAIVAIVWFGVSDERNSDDADDAEQTEFETSEQSAVKQTGDYNSIAVLAFTDMSPGRDQEYFSDGIAEELLNVLARETDLRVAARTSSFAFKDKDDTIAAIGDALNVDAVLEGSVRKSGDKVRITAQLIDAQSGFHLWSQTYDREIADVFSVQDEIANAIVRSLPSAGSQQEFVSVAQANSEAYDLYLQARHQLARRTRSSIEASRSLLERAIAIDPQYAPAHADLAVAVLLLREGPSTYGDLTLQEVEAIAAPAVKQALVLDPTLAEAHAAKGLLLGHLSNPVGAIAAYREAIEYNPSVANARHLLYLALMSQGEFVDAFSVIDQAVVLDPMSSIILENYSNSLILRGQFEEALSVARRINNLFPEWPHSKTALARAYAANGKLAESLREYERAVAAMGGSNLDEEAAFSAAMLQLYDHALLKDAPVGPASFIHVVEGRPGEARSMVLQNSQSQPENPFVFWRAVWTLWATGDDEQALEFAEDFIARQTGDTADWASPINWAMPAQQCYPGIYVAGLWQRAGNTDRAAPLLEACRRRIDRMKEQGYVLQYFERDMEAELLVLEGKYDAALAELRRLTDTGKFVSWWIRVEPIYRPLYDDPRFQEIVADLDAFAERERARYLAFADTPE